jgi:hypothetical protein
MLASIATMNLYCRCSPTPEWVLDVLYVGLPMLGIGFGVLALSRSRSFKARQVAARAETTKSLAVARLLAEARRTGAVTSDFVKVVQRVTGVPASPVNDGGLERQFAFLVAHQGEARVRARLAEIAAEGRKPTEPDRPWRI